MKIQPIVEHEPPHKGVEGEAQASEEVWDKHNALIGLRRRDNLPWSRKPVLNVGGQVSDLPKLHNVLLLDRGGHPLAFRVGFGHIGGSGVLDLRSWVLELEVREGAGEVEKRHRPRSLYKGVNIKSPQRDRLRFIQKYMESLQRSSWGHARPY